MKPTLQAEKISDTEISIEKTIPEVITPAKVSTTTYERGFIETQIESITKQRDSMIAEKENLIALKEKELAECQEILAEMDKKGIVLKPVEQMPENLENEVLLVNEKVVI